MHDTEKNADENAGDQDENVSDFARAAAGDDSPRPACGVLATHDRHVLGSASAPIHCAGWTSPADQELTYVAAFQLWQSENPWSSRYGTLVHHARVLARKLDRAGDEAPAATSSAYLQAISRLERMRPGATAPAGPAGDGLTPPGEQPDLFSSIDDED